MSSEAGPLKRGLPRVETAARLVVELTLEPASEMPDTCCPTPHSTRPQIRKWLLNRDLGSLPESLGRGVQQGPGLPKTGLPAWPTNANVSKDHQAV